MLIEEMDELRLERYPRIRRWQYRWGSFRDLGTTGRVGVGNYHVACSAHPTIECLPIG